MNRITKQQLRAVQDLINKTLGTPMESLNPAKRDDGLHWNAGHYAVEVGNRYISHKLVRHTGEHGCTSTILSTRTKQELFDQCHALLRGIELGRAKS